MHSPCLKAWPKIEVISNTTDCRGIVLRWQHAVGKELLSYIRYMFSCLLTFLYLVLLIAAVSWLNLITHPLCVPPPISLTLLYNQVSDNNWV